MKYLITLKILCVLFFLFCCSLSSFAIDIITQNDGVQIEAIIVKLNKKIVVYKLYSDPLGPKFKLQPHKINSIQLTNGSIWHYNEIIKKQLEYTYPLIEKKGHKRYTIDGKDISYEAYLENLRINYPSTYASYTRGKQLTNLGAWSLGLSPLVVGSGVALLYAFDDGFAYMGPIGGLCLFSGVTFCAIGSLMAVSSIPLLSVGIYKRNSTYTTYTKERHHIINENALEITPFVAPNSVGLAIRF